MTDLKTIKTIVKIGATIATAIAAFFVVNGIRNNSVSSGKQQVIEGNEHSVIQSGHHNVQTNNYADTINIDNSSKSNRSVTITGNNNSGNNINTGDNKD